MIAGLSFGALVLGTASGGLVAAIVSLALSGLLAVLGLDDGPSFGLITGVVLGLFAGGWVSGSRASHSQRFHGMMTGVLLAFLIVIIARFGGSPASTPVVLWLAFLSILIGGVGGGLAGRRPRSS